MTGAESTQQPKKQIRVWADGCFDVTHWGHMNALRQAKALGDILVVGVHSDADILKHKGPTIMNEEERYAVVRACKWVDEVVEAAPYVVSMDVFDDHDIDFCVHGEDITTDENGNDVYAEAKDTGRYKTISRTQGVSTTDIVGRMILRTKEHLNSNVEQNSVTEMASPYTRLSRFYPSSQRIVQFSGTQKSPAKDDTIVYMDGAFDLFHVGHIEALRHAKEVGNYLIVGIHDDEVVNSIKGKNLPIMNLHERVLSVLACEHVDDVIISAPWQVSQEMIDQLGIDFVLKGSFADYPSSAPEPYVVPKKLGILREFQSSHTDLTSDCILKRIINNLQKYENRNRTKQQCEIEYIEAHTPTTAGMNGTA